VNRLERALLALVSKGGQCVLSETMTSKRTKRFLYAFIISQPLVLLLLALDQKMDLVDVHRRIIHLALALPWGAAALATITTLRELGVSMGRESTHWALAVVLVYGVQYFSAQEIYTSYIVPINLIVFPILTVLLSHINLRDTY
jgi:hypothetical protein